MAARLTMAGLYMGEGADMICNMHGVSSVKLNRCTCSHIKLGCAITYFRYELKLKLISIPKLKSCNI